MIKIEKVEVYGFEPALRGMRNPKKSWDKSDSFDCITNWSCKDCPYYIDNGSVMCKRKGDISFVIGKNDHELAMKLVKAGSAHAKFRRMIAVWVDITAPRYFWTEFDTYKVGTVSNSESTMHTIHQKPFELGDFSNEKLSDDTMSCEYEFDKTGAFVGFENNPYTTLNETIAMLNSLRELFLVINDKNYWYQMIQLLPQSYNQKRTVFLNYEVLANMYRLRKNHKLDEWKEFCKWIETLPYSEFITGEDK